jgi:hypothetical protein
VAANEHAVAGRRAQAVDGSLLPGEVGGLGHELVGPDDRQLGEAAVIGLEAPDALVGGEHRVVVRRRVLVVDVVAVDHDPVSRCPVAHRGADAQHHAGGVRPDHVEVLLMPRGPGRLAGQTVEEPEGRQWLEDRRPHRVEVDRAGHDGEVDLVGRQLGCGHVPDVQRLARVLVL